MKITGVKVFLVNPGERVSYGTGWSKNLVLVKVYTDAGIEGVGEAFATGKARTTEAAVYEYERWLMGKDPTEIVRHWYAYYRGARYPLGTATMAALSAVEQALWDIAGKACGLPVYKMLGGPFRRKIRLYASGYLAQRSHFFVDGGGTLVDGAKAVVAAGFTALKFTPQPDDYQRKSWTQILNDSIERVRSVREAVGADIDICLDYHGRSFSPAEAGQLAQAIEPYRPYFLEEPALTESPESLVEVKMKTNIPIAGGERCISRDRLKEILEKRAVHVLQPEPTCNGGILETLRWAAMAELYHITLAPHQACGPVSFMACVHIDACAPNFLIQECNVDFDSQFIKDLFPERPAIEQGYVLLPEKPGLGVTFNEEAAAKYPYRPFDRPVIVRPDGGIGLE
ncbi:MAG: mandelate racemase/muconate lactonizing enzyme family protein [Verrucomicrobia bacterium]|nr:mandelate racemase/muconate lactonizing enzyme family protein [Verrucomicrobiota bacterium]